MSNAVEELIAHEACTPRWRIQWSQAQLATCNSSESKATFFGSLMLNFQIPLRSTTRRFSRYFAIIGKPFSRSAIELFEFEQVRPIYLTHAFLRVKFAPPTARFEGDPTKPLPDKVLVLAPIEPGPAYTWGGVEWTGNSVIPTAELDKFVELKPGEVADGVRMEAGWNRVTDAYGTQGYLDAKLSPTPHYDDKAARVSYVVPISEGPQYRMGRSFLPAFH
jgi:hypothetical protein